MGNFTLGLQAMFRIWGDPIFGEKIKDLLEDKPAPVAVAPQIAPAKEPSKRMEPPKRSEALTLLAVLQREARLVDFIQEPITGYTDAQIGAAARTVHDACLEVFQRIFSLEPLRQEPDGSQIEVPAGADSAEFRLVGNVGGSGPFRGTLAHPGWRAGKCELPAWTGRTESALVIAPCEVELK